MRWFLNIDIVLRQKIVVIDWKWTTKCLYENILTHSNHFHILSFPLLVQTANSRNCSFLDRWLNIRPIFSSEIKLFNLLYVFGCVNFLLIHWSKQNIVPWISQPVERLCSWPCTNFSWTRTCQPETLAIKGDSTATL